MSDRIIINDMRIFANHGVFDFEKKNAQEFRIDCILEVDLHKAGVSDNLEDTINYAQICELINDITIGRCFDLLETLAEEICNTILTKYQSINSVEITVLKTNAPISVNHDSIGISIKRTRHTAYLSIGSNIGDSKQFLDFAISELSKQNQTKVTKVSDYIITKPYGGVIQPDFLNAALEIKTLLTPDELLNFTSSIEYAAGRTRETHWGPRTLDIDIIFYDDITMYEKHLIIPHIEAHKRLFVLKPLCDIAPYKIHPVIQKSVLELYNNIESECE